MDSFNTTLKGHQTTFFKDVSITVCLDINSGWVICYTHQVKGAGIEGSQSQAQRWSEEYIAFVHFLLRFPLLQTPLPNRIGTSFVTPDGSFKPSLLIEALFSFRNKAFHEACSSNWLGWLDFCAEQVSLRAYISISLLLLYFLVNEMFDSEASQW